MNICVPKLPSGWCFLRLFVFFGFISMIVDFNEFTIEILIYIERIMLVLIIAIAAIGIFIVKSNRERSICVIGKSLLDFALFTILDVNHLYLDNLKYFYYVIEFFVFILLIFLSFRSSIMYDIIFINVDISKISKVTKSLLCISGELQNNYQLANQLTTSNDNA